MPASWTAVCLLPPGNVAAGYSRWARARFSASGTASALALPPLALLALSPARLDVKTAIRLARRLAGGLPRETGAFVPGGLVAVGGWLFQELGGPFELLAWAATAGLDEMTAGADARAAKARAGFPGDEAKPPLAAGIGIFLGEVPGEGEAMAGAPSEAFLAAEIAVLRLRFLGPGLSRLTWTELARARRLKGRPSTSGKPD